MNEAVPMRNAVFFNRRRLWIWGIGSTIGVIIGITMAERGEGNLAYAVLLLLLLLLALYLQVLLHELGHLIMGRLNGFELQSFRVMGLIYERENGRFTWRFRSTGRGGLIIMFPKNTDTTRTQSILYFSGGVLMHLVSIVIYLLLLELIPASGSVAAYFFYVSIIIAAALLVGNLIPYTTRSNIRSDGKHILNALLNNVTYKYQQQLFFLSAKSMNGVRPADLEKRNWQDVSAIPTASTKVSFLIIGYYHYLDAGDHTAALQCIRQAEQHLQGYPEILQQNIQAEIMFAAMVLESDREKAGRIYPVIQSQLEEGEQLTKLRIRAAYSWFVLEDAASAQQIISRAYGIADYYQVRGFIAFERALLKMIQERIDASFAPGDPEQHRLAG